MALVSISKLRGKYKYMEEGRGQVSPDVFLQRTQGEWSVQSGSSTAGHGGDKPSWAFNDFLNYVTSPKFTALGPVHDNDLSYPISNYFISSSHNTYLTGHQLYGQSTVDGYTNVGWD